MAGAEVSNRRIASDIGLQLVARVANVALGLVVTIVLVRALGDARFGQWSTALAVAGIVGYLGDLGLEQVAVREAAAAPAAAGAWIGSLVTLRLAIALPATLVSAAVAVALSTDTTMAVTGTLLCATTLAAAFTTARAVFQVRMRNSLIAGLELANGLLWGAGAVAVAVLHGGMIAFAAAFLGSMAALAAVQFALARRALPFGLRADREQWRRLVHVGVPVALSSLLILAYGRIDQVLVFRIVGDHGAGLYGAAYRILDRSQVVPASILATLFPLIATAHGTDPARVRRLVQAGVDVLATISLPALALSIVVARDAMRLLFGAEFAPAGPTLAILTGVFAMTAFGYLAGYLVIVLGLQRSFLRYALLGLVINVGLNLLLLPRYGYVAAAWATLVTNAAVVGLATRLTLRTIEHRLAIGRLVRLAGAAALSGLAAWGAREAGAPLAVQVAAWAVVAPAAILLLRTWSVSELRAAIGR